MTRPKVLFILHLPPPTYGATIVGSYIKESKTINDAFEADYINLATNKILNQTGKGTLKKLFTLTEIIRQVVSALKHKNYDLCYVTLTSKGGAFYKDLLIVSVLKLFRKKIIYHFHNKGVSESENQVSKSLYRYAFKNTKSILLSRYLYSDIQKYVSETDVYYCPCGIPVDQSIYENLNSRIDKKNEVCQLMFLSNMMLEKGIYILLEACQKLKEKGIPFECHYIGGWIDVSETEFKRKIIEKNLTDVVFIQGPKYNEEKREWFRRADVFIFPTYYHNETFGLVNLEAMQYGLPIISTPEGGIPEMVVDGVTGFLVPQQNATELAEKLTVLIENPSLRNKMGIAGKQRFFDFFTLEKFEQNLSQILKIVISEK